jgi:putative hydrolase of the HAD superfamily
MIRWIAFDAVGTLIEPEPDVATVYAVAGWRHGSRLSTDDVRSRFRRSFAESTEACLPRNDGDVVTSEELEVERWRWIVARVLDDVADPQACFQELYEHFARAESWRVFDDAGPALEALQRAGLRLALASNFDRRLHDVCRGLPVLSVIERIVVSTDVGACKPSRRFFTSLLDTCACRADELLMVGDDREADILGPQRSGISAVLIDRRAATNAPEVIHSLAELPALVGRT